MKMNFKYVNSKSSFAFVLLVSIAFLWIIPETGHCNEFLFSANPNSKTITKISLITGASLK